MQGAGHPSARATLCTLPLGHTPPLSAQPRRQPQGLCLCLPGTQAPPPRRGQGHSPAMLMKRCEKMDRWMGSSWAPTVLGASAPTEMRMSPVSVTSAWQPGSTRMVLRVGVQEAAGTKPEPASQIGTPHPQAGGHTNHKGPRSPSYSCSLGQRTLHQDP